MFLEGFCLSLKNLFSRSLEFDLNGDIFSDSGMLSNIRIGGCHCQCLPMVYLIWRMLFVAMMVRIEVYTSDQRVFALKRLLAST